MILNDDAVTALTNDCRIIPNLGIYVGTKFIGSVLDKDSSSVR